MKGILVRFDMQGSISSPVRTRIEIEIENTPYPKKLIELQEAFMCGKEIEIKPVEEE